MKTLSVHFKQHAERRDGKCALIEGIKLRERARTRAVCLSSKPVQVRWMNNRKKTHEYAHHRIGCPRRRRSKSILRNSSEQHVSRIIRLEDDDEKNIGCRAVFLIVKHRFSLSHWCIQSNERLECLLLPFRANYVVSEVWKRSTTMSSMPIKLSLVIRQEQSADSKVCPNIIDLSFFFYFFCALYVCVYWGYLPLEWNLTREEKDKNLYGDKWSSVIDMSRTVSWLPSTPLRRLVFCLSLSLCPFFLLLRRFNLSEVILSWTNSVSAHTHLMLDTIALPFSSVVSPFVLLFDFSRLRLVHRLKRGREKEEKSVPSPVNTCRLPIYHWSYHLISHSISSCWDNTKFAFVSPLMSNVQIIKPIAKYAGVTGILPIPTPSKPLAVAGTTLKEGSVVYLLHQLSYNFLLTEFYDQHQHYNRIPVRSTEIARKEISLFLSSVDSRMESTFNRTRSSSRMDLDDQKCSYTRRAKHRILSIDRNELVRVSNNTLGRSRWTAVGLVQPSSAANHLRKDQIIQSVQSRRTSQM